MFANNLYSVFDGSAILVCESFFDDTESADSDLATDSILADFLIFIIWRRGWCRLLCKTLQPLNISKGA